MLATGFEFFTNEANPIEIDSHSEFFVLLLYFTVAGTFLCKSLMIHSQGKYDICTDFTGMECAVKTAKFNCVVPMKETMKIEKMVAAVMVVAITVSAITGVPNLFKLCECSGFLLVHAFYQVGIHLFAIPHALILNLKCFVEQIIAASDEVNEITDGSWRVRRTVEVDMDTTGVICEAASFTQATYNVLQGSNIFTISKNWADELTGIQ